MCGKMLIGTLIISALACTLSAQQAPGSTPGAPARSQAIAREVQGLTAEDFPERQAALNRLQALIAGQVRQRAEIQEVLNTLQADLTEQLKVLSVVTDEEAQAQAAGLLEMERGLCGWTLETMTQPVERRKTLLAWGLSPQNAPILARAYATSVSVRIEGIKQLASLDDDGASWTLGRLVNDKSTPVRAAAMAACWDRKPHDDIVEALWYRAVSGPQVHSARMRAMGESAGMPEVVMVDFPGREPMEFGIEDEGRYFFDSQLAGGVLVNLKSPLVAQRMKDLVAALTRTRRPMALSDDPDWTLVTHRLVEVYQIKEAIPVLAATALGAESEGMGTEMNGRSYMWSRRTMAIGTLARLANKDPADFELVRVRDMGDSWGWIWATEMAPNVWDFSNADVVPMRAFFNWWKDNHAQFGVTEAPSDTHIPQERRGRGRDRPMPDDDGEVIPLPVIPPDIHGLFIPTPGDPGSNFPQDDRDVPVEGPGPRMTPPPDIRPRG